MLFSKEDFEISSVGELVEFLPILIFMALVAPFIIGAYKLGFLMDITGWLEKSDYPK